MRIDGKALAGQVLSELKQAIDQQSMQPTLAVILIGDDPGSVSYIRQKKLAAEKIGAKTTVIQYETNVTASQLQDTVQTLNEDSNIHGIIIQRPVPLHIKKENQILMSILPHKDVDGFLDTSPYPVPVAQAIIEVLTYIHKDARIQTSLDSWLSTQYVTIIGRGETAGRPIAKLLTATGLSPHIVHSQTPHPQDIYKQSDILISCVGKQHTIHSEDIKKAAIILSVGLSKDSSGTLHGDYEENDVQDVAAYYTPTPGGIGPINVACLMKNLVTAALSQTLAKNIKGE